MSDGKEIITQSRKVLLLPGVEARMLPNGDIEIFPVPGSDGGRIQEVARFADALIDDLELGTAGKIDVNEARRALERLMGWEEGTLTSARDNGYDRT